MIFPVFSDLSFKIPAWVAGRYRTPFPGLRMVLLCILSFYVVFYSTFIIFTLLTRFSETQFVFQDIALVSSSFYFSLYKIVFSSILCRERENFFFGFSDFAIWQFLFFELLTIVAIYFFWEIWLIHWWSHQCLLLFWFCVLCCVFCGKAFYFCLLSPWSLNLFAVFRPDCTSDMSAFASSFSSFLWIYCSFVCYNNYLSNFVPSQLILALPLQNPDLGA